MKKIHFLAMWIFILSGCYAPLNNSGVATTKSWLDIPAKKTDFDGKQFDSCYQFRLRFIPADAEAQLDLRESCIDACCWRSNKEEIVLDFNKNFEQNLRYYGRADRYTPGKITLQVSHSNLLNTTSVKVYPRGAVSTNGTVKLKRKTVENPTRLAQIENEARRLQARRNAWLADQKITEDEEENLQEDFLSQKRAKTLLQRTEGAKIDRYFYETDKKYKQKGLIFLISKRLYSATLLPDGNYRVSCRAKVQSGTQVERLQNRTLSCGVWQVNLSAGTVTPADGTARRIKTLH